MTDTERLDLDRFMAEKVMGWEAEEAGEGRLYRYYLDSQGAVTGYTVGDWTPSPWSPRTDPRAASQVMARLTELGWEVTIVASADGCVASLERNEKVYLELLAATWPEALCRAVKQAWEATYE